MSLRYDRFIPMEPIPTLSSKAAEREQVAREVADYLASGGKITVITEPKPAQRCKAGRDGIPRYSEGFVYGDPLPKPQKRVTESQKAAIQEAVKLIGGFALAAKKLGMSSDTVRNLCLGSTKLTHERAVQLCDLTGGRVNVKAMTDD